MKNKGFTLIELLAVIVVLAIISLIAIPIIANVIDKAKEGSAIDSSYGYIDALEKNIALGEIDPSKGIRIPSSNTLSMGDIEGASILESLKIKGTKPDYVEVTFERKKVKTAGFCMDGYNLEYKNKEIVKSSTNYCGYVNVTELKVKNEEITFDGNNGNLILKPGEELELDIEVITKDNSNVEPEIILEPTDTTVISLSGKKITANNLGMTVVYVKAGIKYKKIIVNVINDSILGYLEVHDYGETGEYNDTITANGESYDAHVYNYKGNQEWTTSTVPNGGIFGDDSDIGTASTNATKMVIVKVDGNLTIGEGVTVLPKYTNYGGPKGFLIYVTGTLTNNGTIDNSHGAKAVGQAVYLWQNATFTSDANKFEVVPAVGATGGVGVKNGSGLSGNPGSNRATGGGGSGFARSTASLSGNGGTGTSYSGGTGSGSANNQNGGIITSSNAGSSTGGAGSSGTSDATGISGVKVGGVGNPTPASSLSASSGWFVVNNAPENGTGGLLIVYANNIINNTNSKITANGHNSGRITAEQGNTVYAGGSSGGGSINIFFKGNYTAPTTINANGGVMAPGGSGGNGSITIGSIKTGTFVANS